MDEFIHRFFSALDIIESTAVIVTVLAIYKLMPDKEPEDNESYRHKLNKDEILWIILSIHCQYMTISKFLG